MNEVAAVGQAHHPEGSGASRVLQATQLGLRNVDSTDAECREVVGLGLATR